MPSTHTRFYLDKQNAKWSGVCAGIADYTGINVAGIRIALVLFTLFGGFPWTLIAYWIAAWSAQPKPIELYAGRDEEKFWQGVRQSPRRTAKDVRARFRDIDRRLADMELYYTSRNSQLAREIENLR